MTFRVTLWKMKMTETITVTGVGAEASVSPAMTALEEKRQKKIAEEIKTQEELEASIPKPVGYRVLIALPNVEETFGDSGLVKARLNS
jgi:hypothetical protein